MKCYAPGTPREKPFLQEGTLVPIVLPDGTPTEEIVPFNPMGEFYEVVETGTGVGYTDTIDAPNLTVNRARFVPPTTLDEAKKTKEVEFRARAREAIQEGIPVTGPQGTAILAYADERDREIWSAWNIGMTAPPSGYRVNLLQPYGPKNKMQLTLNGEANINDGKQKILDHIAATTLALDDGIDDTNDATTVAEVEAISVSDPKYAWPSNTVPA